MKAVGEWVLVDVELETKSKGGIVIPKGASAKLAVIDGTVVSIGEDVFGDDTGVSTPQFKVGSKVKIHKQLLIMVDSHLAFVKPNGIMGLAE